MAKVKMPCFECLDCGVDTKKIKERYAVKNSVWKTANPAIKGMLCIRCLEKRLGRLLVSDDFMGAPLNGWKEQSSVLAERTNGISFKKPLRFYYPYFMSMKQSVVDSLLCPKRKHIMP